MGGKKATLMSRRSQILYTKLEKNPDWSFSRSNQSCGSKGRGLEINSAVIGQLPQHVRTGSFLLKCGNWRSEMVYEVFLLFLVTM